MPTNLLGNLVIMPNPSNPNNLPGFHVPEGFGRVTRDGKTEIFVVLNKEPLGSYILSVAYEMDDFAEGRDCGDMLYLEEADAIEHLGGIQEYLNPTNPVEKWRYALLREFPRTIGLLPIVRACEKLQLIGRSPTAEDVQTAVREGVAVYYTRRLLIEAGRRRAPIEARSDQHDH